jgi:glutamine amidotransferase-like uncharacterized protein
MKNKNELDGSEWGELFYEEHIEMDEVIELGDSEIMFTTKGGTKFKEYNNYKKIEIIEVGDDADDVKAAITKIENNKNNKFT